MFSNPYIMDNSVGLFVCVYICVCVCVSALSQRINWIMDANRACILIQPIIGWTIQFS